MVLNELGRRINSALRSLSDAPVISDELIDELLKDICAALLESDVNVKLVQQLRKNVKKEVSAQATAESNKRRLVQKVSLSHSSTTTHLLPWNRQCWMSW